MFYYAKTSTFIQCRSLFQIKMCKRNQFEDSLFDLCSCLRRKLRLKRTLLHVIKQCTISSIAKFTVILYYMFTEEEKESF